MPSPAFHTGGPGLPVLAALVATIAPLAARPASGQVPRPNIVAMLADDQGWNGRAAYDAMCSKEPGIKRYHVTVYALAARSTLPAGSATREARLRAIAATTLAEGTLTVTYEHAAS